MNLLFQLIKRAGRAMIRSGIWVPASAGPEVYSVMGNSAKRAIEIGGYHRTFEQLHLDLEAMSDDCLRWIQDQIDNNLASNPDTSERAIELGRQAQSIGSAVQIYFAAWEEYRQTTSAMRRHFLQTLRFSANTPTVRQEGNVQIFRYSTADCEQKYETARSAAIDLAEAVLAVVPEDLKAAAIAQNFLARTAEPETPDRQRPSSNGSSPEII